MGLGMAKPYLKTDSPGDAKGAGATRHWLAAYTKARHETAVARQLEAKTVAHLLPTFLRSSRWSDRIKRTISPLFPGYLGVFPRRLVVVIRDITEAANIRERLREREVLAATGMLLAGAAHQAKNAIFGLSATLDAFEARFDERAAADPYVESLRAGIARMQSLLRDLLDYANRSECEAQPTSLSAVARCSAGACKALALKMGVKLTVDAAEDPRVLGDAPRLVRALENLLENAIQHSPQNGTVTVRISRPQTGDRGYWRCEVLDQGPGFPPEHIEKLFAPFFTRRPGGTGLGLTIAKKIVEDAGGLIGLSNNREGGARVCVFLPGSNHSEMEFRNDVSECDDGGK
jgi:signal transduction histidine kinase